MKKKTKMQRVKTNQRPESSRPAIPYHARVKVVGVGGGGGNAVSRMADTISVRSIEFIAINTDAQDLDYCNARRKIYIGKNLTRGLGTGMNPDIGRQAAEENRSEITDALQGADLVFLTIGLGGGTGSGAGPVVAEVARECGALVVAVVTKPFSFEGTQRTRIAEEAFGRLREKVDTIIAVPNDRIFSIIRKDTPLLKAFAYIDDVLRGAVEGIAELIAMPGIINVDFADVKAIMRDSGPALVGVGIATGQDRALAAVNQVVNSPLLEIGIEGARGVLFGVAGNRDLKMNEINEVAKVIAGAVDPSARIIFGAYHDRKLRPGQIKITLIATGFAGQMSRAAEQSMPSLSLFNEAPRVMREPVTTTQAERERERDIKPEPAVREVNPDPAKHSQKGEDLAKKKESDLWDIPTFLRKKK